MEIALIGFDGLDPRVVYDKRKELPNFDSLISKSMHGEWQTPAHTIPSFTATLTGKKYLNYNFHWDEGKGDYREHRQTEFDFLWDSSDASMSLVNIPTLYPPENIDDCMVCGFLTPDSVMDSNLARPVELQEHINETDYIPDVPADDTYDELGKEGMLNVLQDMMMERVKLSAHVINEYDSDLFYGVWTATDRWFHQCHRHGHEPYDLYKLADDVLGEMLNIIPSDIPLIVFSDHGFAHFQGDGGVHKGHMHKGWYCLRHEETPQYRNDSMSIYDLYPTVYNYLEGETPEEVRGRLMFHTEDQDEDVKNRLQDLGYM